MVEVTTSGGGRRRCVWKEERERRVQSKYSRTSMSLKCYIAEAKIYWCHRSDPQSELMTRKDE